MMRAIRMIGWDLLLQLRHHIFTANIVSTAFICGFILVMPVRPLPPAFAAFLIFADPALIGLAFVGAIVLMEKAARVNAVLGVSPSPPWVYLLSKTLTLTAAGTLAGLAVAFVARQGQVDWGLMVVALVVSNALAVIVGFALVARCESMNDMMVRLLYASTVIFAPLIPHFHLTPPVVGLAMTPIPSTAMLALLDNAVEPGRLSAQGQQIAIGYLVVLIVLSWLWALREYRTSMITEGR